MRLDFRCAESSSSRPAAMQGHTLSGPKPTLAVSVERAGSP
jgi:hypothetical protein